MVLDRNKIIKVLRLVKLKNFKKNIIDSKLIANIDINDSKILINVLLTEPSTYVMHVKKKLKDDIIKILHNKIDQNLNIRVMFKIKEILHNKIKIIDCKKIIAIASGKGGVGKSTIASNIAVGLSMQGFNVCLFDADFYGPSIPIMFDSVTSKLSYNKKINSNSETVNKIKPIIKYGVKLLSLGFIVDINQAVALRGPMISKIFKEIIFNSDLTNLDILIIDLPPGTGDLHISIMQNLHVDGVVIVSTPQVVSLSDVKRSIAMLQIPSVNIPIIGLIENMSYFFTPDNKNKKYFIFGNNGVRNLSNDLNIDFLGEVPIYQSIREASDYGRPIILQKDNSITKFFDFIIKNIINKLNMLNVK